MRDPFLRPVSIFAAGINFATNAVEFVMIVFARRAGASAAEVGIMLTIGAAGGLGGATVVQYLLRFHAGGLMIAAAWTWSLLLPLLMVAQNVFAIGGLLAALLFVAPVATTAYVARLIATVPLELQGRASAAASLTTGFAAPAGPFVAGLLLEALSRANVVLAVTAMAALLAALLTAARAVRESPPLAVTR